MLINKVCEDTDGAGAGQSSVPEYRTASELFDLMTKNTRFESDNDSLSAQDLILLYQNMDLGTRLMNDANELAVKKPNQYVETVVYNEPDEQASDSDAEMYTSAEIHDVFAANQERLDFLNNNSLENLLCHKLGEVSMHTSDLGFDYDKKFLFQDPYIKNQLKNFNILNGPSESDNLFSTSLIDYICCKRLEDNYNFYMDNIIRYVQHTIEQLKRISNGDYLTDRAKEKWREVISSNVGPENDASTKVLATSTSIPLHVEGKVARKVTWDELIRSEVDVRSLSKILEKKIIVEIPKLIYGSYRLYSKRCNDNFIISCQKEAAKDMQDSRVDVVLKLQRSQTGHVISNISSIMILKTTPALPDLRIKGILPLASAEEPEEPSMLPVTNTTSSLQDTITPAVTVIEIIKNPVPVVPDYNTKEAIVEEVTGDADENEGSYAGTTDYPMSDRHNSCASIQCSSGTSLIAKDTEMPVYPTTQEEFSCNMISPHDLQMTMRRLTMRKSTLEENAEDTTSQSTSKKRSPMRNRIKSPYENKSFSIEEKKRKRLLEIRERREKRKLALSESCKITKHKYAKGAVMPQASSSVTRLSITNRSFYNSIYGQNSITEPKPGPRKSRNTPDESLRMDEDYFDSPMISPDKNSKKYVNRSYYLDEAETEMTYLQRMKGKDIQSPHSTTNSVVSTDFGEHLDLFKHLMNPSETNLTSDFIYESKPRTSQPELYCSEGKPLLPIAECDNRPTTLAQHNNTKPSGDECRKSIDQLYDLMKHLGKRNRSAEGDNNSNEIMESNDVNATSSIHGSESGSSVKHSPQANNVAASKSRPNKLPTPVTPKSAMASKQSPKAEADKAKRERSKRVVISSPFKGPLPENPLKAISQLLHEFENTQKKQKSPDAKPHKKPEVVTNDPKLNSRQGFYRRRSRLDEHRENEQEKKSPPVPNVNPRDKRNRPPLESARSAYQHESPKKKIADIIDEAKEARGEAVRGPPKFPSRLESLAQPKKCYVQAHHDEYQRRSRVDLNSRNVMVAERLHRLVTTRAPASPPAPARASPVNKNRCRKPGPELAAGASVKQRAPSVPLIEQRQTRVPRRRRSASSSPDSPARHSPRRKRSPNQDKPDCMGKKMVAVESYLNSHYRAVHDDRHAGAGLRCRVPFVPHDIEIASLRLSGTDESLGALQALAPALEPRLAPALAALAECSESPPASEPPRSDSDYCVNILEDRHITTAVGLCTDSTTESLHRHPNSTTELEKLENALYSHISGSFQKRLRIKNLTLTPKTSMQQVFLLQSGDAGSVLVKSVSNIKLNRRSAQSLHELKTMPVLSNTHIDWRFTQIPMQIATVGYAFTQNKAQSVSGSSLKLTEVPISETREHTVQQACRSSQCYRGDSRQPLRDASAQVDVANEVISNIVENATNNDTNPEASKGKESKSNETHIDTIFALNEIRNDDNMVRNSESDSKEEDGKPSTEISSTVAAAVEPAPAPAPSVAPSLASPEYTTSLDMLVGLLNEIQKITCQNQIAAADQQNATESLSDRKQSTELIPTRSNSISRLESPHNLIAMKSLENLRQLESNASIFTYYMSNNDTTTSSNNKIDSVVELKKALRFSDVSVVSPKQSVVKEHVAVEVRSAPAPAGVDKEVSANMCKHSVDTCGSQLSATSALTWQHASALLVTPSDSVISLRDYHSCSNALRTPAIKKIIELPQIEASPPRALITRNDTGLKEKRLTSFAAIRNIENVKTEKSLKTRCEVGKYCVTNIDLDPMFRFKRDILVSVYSILVLTVFAALSFPELLIFQS